MDVLQCKITIATVPFTFSKAHRHSLFIVHDRANPRARTKYSLRTTTNLLVPDEYYLGLLLLLLRSTADTTTVHATRYCIDLRSGFAIAEHRFAFDKISSVVCMPSPYHGVIHADSRFESQASRSNGRHHRPRAHAHQQSRRTLSDLSHALALAHRGPPQTHPKL